MIDEYLTAEEILAEAEALLEELERWTCLPRCWRCEAFFLPPISQTLPANALFTYWREGAAA